jgi:hypothetical protein
LDKPPRNKPAGSAQDAAGRAWQPSRGRLVIALLLAVAGCTALFLLWMPSWIGGQAEQAIVAPAPQVAAVPSPPTAPAPKAPVQQRAPEGDADPTRDLSSYVARGENPSMGDVIKGLHERGIFTGLGAFSPPGTSPPLVGLAVPEDFALPKGYVRHHQATDDGQRIEAVLMFAPDFQLTNANGQPVDMPKNRVVPPELAPPGLPLRRIVIPPPANPSGH